MKVAEADLARVRAELAGTRASRPGGDRSEVLDEYQRKRKVVESGAVPEGPVIRLGGRIESIDVNFKAWRPRGDRRPGGAEARPEGDEDRELLIAEILGELGEAEVEIAQGGVEMAAVALDGRNCDSIAARSARRSRS